jgi:hypothetical protein
MLKLMGRAKCDWSSRRGAADAAASPLIKPDGRISRIRLTRDPSALGIHKVAAFVRQQLQAQGLHVGV